MKSWLYGLTLLSVLGWNASSAATPVVAPCAEVVQKLIKRHQTLLDRLQSSFTFSDSDSYYPNAGFSDVTIDLAMDGIQSELTLSSIKSRVKSAQEEFDQFLEKWKKKTPDCFL